MLIQDFEPKEAYVQGKENYIADALSRAKIKWNDVSKNLVEKREETPYLLMIENAMPLNCDNIGTTTERPTASEISLKSMDGLIHTN